MHENENKGDSFICKRGYETLKPNKRLGSIQRHTFLHSRQTNGTDAVLKQGIRVPPSCLGSLSYRHALPRLHLASCPSSCNLRLAARMLSRQKVRVGECMSKPASGMEEDKRDEEDEEDEEMVEVLDEDEGRMLGSREK
eukprot:762550-Hanusia_phi.AAC.2